MSFNRYDYCKFCKAKLPKIESRRYRWFMCNDCYSDRLDGNHAISKICDELRAKNIQVEEDWGAENVEDDDNVPYKPKRKATHVFSRNILDEI